MRIPRNQGENVESRSNRVRESEVRLSAIGRVGWDRTEIRSRLEEFLSIYAQRPILDNQGGMASVGLFNVWFLLNKLQPQFVIESGIWKGQSTWLIERTLPQAKILSIDIDLSLRNFISSRAQYSHEDFLTIKPEKLDWHFQNTLAFFDDHQDVIPRLEKCLAMGIKNIILDDDYPEYSGSRHLSAAACLKEMNSSGQSRFPYENRFLQDHMAAYYLMPPIFEYKEPLTMEKSFLTMDSLLGSYNPQRYPQFSIYNKDMSGYRWTTYLRLQ